MRLNFTERPPALLAACAPAHLDHMGYRAVPSVSIAAWRPLPTQPVAFNRYFGEQQSVQFKRVPVQILRASELTAKTIGMGKSPFTGDAASGVPPRGRPV